LRAKDSDEELAGTNLHLNALQRHAGSDGRLVADQPATQADQDRSPRRATRPRHHFPAGRGRGDRSDGPDHPCCDPPIESATAMRVTAIRTQTEGKPQDRFVRHAEERRCRARMPQVRGPIRPVPGVCATADTAQGEKRLILGQRQATLQSDVRPLGECRIRSRQKWQVFHTFLMLILRKAGGSGNIIDGLSLIHPLVSFICGEQYSRIGGLNGER
jgi:hypothetical protein